MGSRRRLDGKGSVQVMTLQRLAGLAALCGMVVLVTWGAAGRLGFGSPDVRNTEAWKEQRRETSGIAASERIEAPQRTAMGKDAVSTADVLGNAFPNARPIPRSEIPPVHVTSGNSRDPGQGYSRGTSIKIRPTSGRLMAVNMPKNAAGHLWKARLWKRTGRTGQLCLRITAKRSEQERRPRK